MANRERNIEDILTANCEALKAGEWDKASALSLYAISLLMHESAQAPATPAPVETPAEVEAPRRAPRRTSSAGDADCDTCGERFNSKGGRFKRCFPCGKKAKVLCRHCRTNYHQPDFDECRSCGYGEAA